MCGSSNLQSFQMWSAKTTKLVLNMIKRSLQANFTAYIVVEKCNSVHSGTILQNNKNIVRLWFASLSKRFNCKTNRVKYSTVSKEWFVFSGKILSSLERLNCSSGKTTLSFSWTYPFLFFFLSTWRLKKTRMVLRYRTVFGYVNCFHLIVVYCHVEHPHFPPALRRIFHGYKPLLNGPLTVSEVTLLVLRRCLSYL